MEFGRILQTQGGRSGRGGGGDGQWKWMVFAITYLLLAWARILESEVEDDEKLKETE